MTPELKKAIRLIQRALDDNYQSYKSRYGELKPELRDAMNEFIAPYNELLPCPICGGKVEKELLCGRAKASCTECDASWGETSEYFSGRYVKWNKRNNA